jgi:hypothetical protein
MAVPSGVVRLLSVEHSRHGLFLRFGFEELRFSTSYWYQDVDFHLLEARHCAEGLAR